MIRLERVTDALPSGLDAMRTEARAENHNMLDRLAREWEAGETRFDRPGEALYAAYVDEVLAGIGGLTVETAIPGAYRMRRFYVRAPYRRASIAQRLALALLDGIPGHTVTVNAAAGSESFWEALGFLPDRRDGFTHVFRSPPGG
jgi:GNAT superfamily N-acetyltransferase